MSPPDTPPLQNPAGSSPSSEALLSHLVTPKTAGAEGRLSPDSDPAATLADTLTEDPLARVLGAANPLLETARPLLRALAEIPDLPAPRTAQNGDTDRLGILRQTLVRELHQFQYLCDRAGFRREQVVSARYCLCTALDEAVYKLNAAEGDWASRSLLLLFHNETGGGEKFFLLLGHMVQSPREHGHVLELLYQILSLGFEGRYALMADGPRQLETIHRRLLAVLAEQAEAVQPELSPHWRGASGGRMRFMRTVPVWVTASVLGLLLLALYTSQRAELTPVAQALTAEITALAEAPAPKPGVWSDPWQGELPLEQWFSVEEQQQYGLSVDVASQTLRIPGTVAFVNGTNLHKNMTPLLDILAERLKNSSRTAQIIGHTDNTRLRVGSVFRDNKHLSEARAETVVKELGKRGIDPARLMAVGKSDTVPLADNATPAGRAQNRRVEFTLTTFVSPEVTP